jgi:hypothetical protein
MNSPDVFGSEDPVRDVMRGLIPAIDPPLDVIDTRASSLRRTFRLRMAGLTGALVLGTVATAGALTGGASKSAVEVQNRGSRHSKIVVTPTTHGRNTHPNTNTTAPISVTSAPLVAPVPTTNPTPGVSTPSSPGAPIVVPVPTTARTSPSSPTTVHSVPNPVTTTTVPAPNYPPIGPNHTRMTVILDDTGLHAPVTFKANYGSGHAVEILFLDERSNGSPGLDYVKTGTGILVKSWYSGPIRAWALTPGTLQLGVLDYPCLCAIPGVTATVTIVP